MLRRKYANMKLASHVVIDSESNYWFELVGMNEAGLYHYQYNPTTGFKEHFGGQSVSLPKYAIKLANKLIVERANKNELRFGEVRNGKIMYDNLQYHTTEKWEVLLHTL